MSHDDYMTPKARSNNFLSNNNITNQPIHVFTNPTVLSPPITALKSECQRRNIPVQLHSTPEDLAGLANILKQKAFIVIETERLSASDQSWIKFPQKFSYPKFPDNVKVVTFPGKLPLSFYDQAKQKNDVMNIYDRHFGMEKQSSKIKLRKVLSSKDIKYELASPQVTKKTRGGKEVVFQKLLYSDFKVHPDSEFKMLTDSIKNTPNTTPCYGFNELKVAADSMQGKGNMLLFLVDEKGLKEWREYVEKNKLGEKVEFMVLGDLKPSKQLLKSNVYFASDNDNVTSNNVTPQKYLNESEPHAPKNNHRPQLQRVSEQFSASIFSNASSQFQRYMRNWTLDIDPNAKDRKNAEYVIQEQEGKQHIGGPSEPMSKRASRITGRRNSSESSDNEYTNTANNLVDEYNRLRTHNNTASNSVMNISAPNNETEFQRMHNSTRDVNTSKQSIASVSSQKSPSKKMIQIVKKPNDKHQTKHQEIPSNVIQETSEEYRGSNRESIVNLDDHFYHYTQGSGKELGGSAGNVATGNFSKVKNNTVVSAGEHLGSKKSFHQTHPADYRVSNLGYDNPPKQQDLPIESPPISEMRMKERIIDGLTGELIGEKIIDKGNNKKAYETVNVVPYQAEPSKRVSNVPAQVVESKHSIKDPKSLGYDHNSQKAISTSSNKNIVSSHSIAATNQQPYIIDGLSGELLGDSFRRMQTLRPGPVVSQSIAIQSPSTVKSPQIVRPNQVVEPEFAKIPHSSGSIKDFSKSSIATQKKIVNNNNQNQNYQVNVNLNPSNNYIESSTSIRDANGAVEKWSRDNIEVVNSPRSSVYSAGTTTVINQNTNKPVLAQPSQFSNQVRTISGERGQSPLINYNTTSTMNPNSSTSNYQIQANYKVYTPEEYAAKYENGPNPGVRTVTGNAINNMAITTYSNNYNTSTSNPESSSNNYISREYTTSRDYTPSGQNNHASTNQSYTPSGQNYSSSPQKYSSNNYYQSSNNNYSSSKEPQVINRVYIKASDLPQSYSQNYNTSKRYEPSPSHYTHDYKAKLTIDDTDPFHERTPSKNQSSIKKGSYLKRKQDGKRDPYSPYEENNTSQLLSNQKSNVKVYTSDEYQKAVDNRNMRSVSKDSNPIDLSNYDRVVENGVAVYKPKATFGSLNSKAESKPVESIRDNYHQSKVTVVNGTNGFTRYEPSGRDYANSPTRKQGSSYQKALRIQNPLRRPTIETYESRTTIESGKNIIPLRQQRVTPLVYDSRSPMKVTEYRTEGPKNGTTYTYSSPTRHVYERREIVEPRVQASNFNDRVQNQENLIKNDKFSPKDKDKNKLFAKEIVPQRESKQSLPQNEIGIISGIHKNSEIFQLSDGSIMRRNNIKFGINKYKGPRPQEDFEYLGQLKSRIQSKIINLSELNRHILLDKKIATQQQVLVEKQAYSYINTSVNEFYFLLDEELSHVSTWISKYLKGRNDHVEMFRGMEQLYEKVHSEKTNPEYDVVFLFVKNEDLLKVNKKMLPEHCFIVEILNQDFKGLEISQKDHHIKLSKMPLLKLAQKIIIETMLTHIILYQKTANPKIQTDYFNQEVLHLLSLFPEGQFIKQPYDSPLSFEMISTLIDDPKFSRLYIICNDKQMANVVDQMTKVTEQTGVPEEICKIICIPQDNEILRHQEKIESYPRVAWMTNSSKINDYKSLIKYALRQQEDENLYNRQESEEKQKIFFHTRHRNLNSLIEKEFPQRFEFEAFNSLSEVQKKLLKTKSQKSKQTSSPNKKSTQQKGKNLPATVNYLILHPILSEEYIDAKLFKKIFMLGKSDKTQRKVVKVGSNQELLELLKR